MPLLRLIDDIQSRGLMTKRNKTAGISRVNGLCSFVKGNQMTQVAEDLIRKIKLLNDTVWEGRANEPSVRYLAANFAIASRRAHARPLPSVQLHVLR